MAVGLRRRETSFGKLQIQYPTPGFGHVLNFETLVTTSVCQAVYDFRQLVQICGKLGKDRLRLKKLMVTGAFVQR